MATNNVIRIKDSNAPPVGVRNNGTKYIDTEVRLNSNMRVEIVFSLNALPTSVIQYYIFGVRGAISGSTWSAGLSVQTRNEESTECVFTASFPGASSSQAIGTAELGHTYTVIFDFASKRVYLNGTVTTFTTTLTQWTFSDNAYLLNSNSSLAWNKANMTLYSARIYEAGTLIRDYVPAMSGTTAGLNELVTQGFDSGLGSGAFTYIGEAADLFYFGGDKITSLNVHTAVDMVGEELSIDTLTANVIDSVVGVSEIVNVKYGTPIVWQKGDELRGKFYIKKISRVAKNLYSIEAISAIGLLDKIPHQGGVYSRQKFSNLLKDIMARETSNKRISLSWHELEYVEKLNNTSFIAYDEASNNIEVVVTVTLPSAISRNITLFGAYSGANYYTLAVTATQSQNQRDYGTNLLATVGVTQYWDGDNHSLPYLQPGSTHRLGFKGYWDVDAMNIPYYHLDLFCDGELYVGSIPSRTAFSTSTGIALLAMNQNGSLTNIATGAKISCYEVWVNGVKKRHDIFGEREDLQGSIFLYNMLTNAGETIPLAGYSMGPHRDAGNDTPVIPYTIEQTELANMLVSGFLPSASKRENLYQLLFATNANLVKATDGSLIFKWLNDNNPEQITDTDIYAEGQIEYPSEVSEVAVTEHVYNGSNDNVQTLFETEEAVIHKKIYFGNAPIFIPSLEASGGLTLDYATVNYAEVTGIGKLTGCAYQHTETVNSATNPDATENKVVSIRNATLVSSLTSVNVRDRLLQYYKGGIKVKNAIVYGGQTAGKPYVLHNPYEEYVTALLAKLDINISAIDKAEAEYCIGYHPNGGGGIYTHSQLISASGSYTFPEGITSAKVILIGAGDGGAGGSNGTAGENGNKYDMFESISGGHGGTGGAGGQPGSNGKVFSFDLSDRLTHSFQITIGTGGAGGRAGNAGNAGTPTKIKDLSDNTEWTSNSGQRGPFVNPISGNSYALPGTAGIAGGNGGSSNGFIRNPQPGNTANIGNGAASPDNVQYQGGFTGRNQYSYNQYTAGGGCGGGAAVGNSGGNGSDGNYYVDYGNYDAYGGRGGSGANAIARNETPSYGQGGNGGHGGGGGGAGGDAWGNPASDAYVAHEGSGGNGGNGGTGGAGGNGCVIILY